VPKHAGVLNTCHELYFIKYICWFIYYTLYLLHCWISTSKLYSFIVVNTVCILMCVFQDLLPSEEHVRVVRNLVKHLHYFANSTVGDLSAMDELKRFV